MICRGGSVYPADLVVAGIGMERLLTPGRAGEVGDRWWCLGGQNYGRTSVDGIYAAGDVAAFPHPLFGRLRLESWRHAQNHGVAVGRAMADAPIPYDDIPWFWTDQHGVSLQVTGIPKLAARTVMRGTDGFVAVHLAEDGTVVGVSAADNPREIRAGAALISARVRPDIAHLADAALPLRSLVPR